MTKQSRIDLVHAADGSMVLEYSTILGARAVSVGRLMLGRPPRIGAINPNNILAAGLIMYGHLIEGDVTVNFKPAPAFIDAMTGIWPFRIHAVPSTEVAIYAESTEDIGERELTISDNLDFFGRGDISNSFLIVLPHDRFNGFIGSMFSIALASNACYESRRLHGDSRFPAGLVALGIIWSSALKVCSFTIHGNECNMNDIYSRQFSTMSIMGLKLRAGAE